MRLRHFLKFRLRLRLEKSIRDIRFFLSGFVESCTYGRWKNRHGGRDRRRLRLERIPTDERIDRYQSIG